MCTEFKMEKLDYAVNPLEQSNQNHENVLLTICENSEGSQDLIALNGEDVQYEVVRSPEGFLQYRLLRTSPDVHTSNVEIASPTVSQTQVQSSNCHFYVINDSTTNNRPGLISPKATGGVQSNSLQNNRHIIVGNSKKRDEKRRATHNEVERRRRDKINHWIYKLKELLPDSGDSKSKSNGSDSKGGILIKACEYIRQVQEENNSLRECLKENEKKSLENELLRERIEEFSKKYGKISSENEALKRQIGQLRKGNQRLSEMIVDADKLANNFEYNSP